MLCVSLIVQAQSITTIEYYFDRDPGFGKGEKLSTTAEIEKPIDISGLENGVHQLYIRAKDSNNKWSLLQHRTFIKGVTGVTDELPELSRVEYYIDADPGLGYGLPIDITTDEAVYNVSVDNFQADLTTIEDGVHTIYIRAQDSNGHWSLLQHRTFIKGVVGVTDATPEIAYLEYYIDDDPGLGQGESMNFDADGLTLTDIRSNYEIDVSHWANGVHTIYIRAKDSNEHWSLIQSRTFIKFPLKETPKITEVEVKIEGIEPYNDWTSLTNFMPDACITTEFAIIEMCDLPNGEYIIQARATDDQQRTGPITDELLEIDCRTPQIKLDDAKIKDEQPLIVTGTGFKSNCTLDVLVTGIFTGDRNNYETTADEEGNFEFNLVMPHDFESGLYSIEVKCVNQDNNPKVKLFEYEKTAPLLGIQIISPIKDDEIQGDQIIVRWNDLIAFQNQYTNFLGLKKQLSYNVYYKSEADEDWVFVKKHTVEIYKNIPKLFLTTIEVPLEGQYRVKVENAKNDIYFDESEEFAVYGLTNEGYQVDFLWDKSFPDEETPDKPVGVVSDGVARIILQLNDYTDLKNISKVKVSLSDPKGEATTANMLGKVMLVKDDINEYSNEANNAIETSATWNDVNLPTDNKYNFWYVAPDDFSKLGGYFYDQANERYVTVTFSISFNDAPDAIVEREIKIVRPPLMLAHGFNSDKSTWDDFSSYREVNEEVKFIYDSRFYFKEPISFQAFKEFEVNAKVLLGNQEDNSFVGNITRARSEGFACNQVNYVGHSMGGLVVRVAAEENIENNFWNDQNYNQGFVNRLVTINSPHNGSFLPELLSDIFIYLEPELREFDYTCFYRSRLNLFLVDNEFEKFGIDYNFNINLNEFGDNECELSIKLKDALKDMKITDGYDLLETKINSHLLASEILINENFEDIDEFVNLLNELEEPLNILEGFIASYIPLVSPESLNNTIIGELLGLIFNNAGEETGVLLGTYSKYISILKFAALTYEGIDFLEDTDGVVSIQSQLANIQSEDYYTVFDRTVHGNIPVIRQLGKPVTQSTDAGNRVFDLLNYGLEEFISSIPAKDKGGLVAKENLFNNLHSTYDKTSTKIFRTNPEGIKIIQPKDGEVVFADSLLNIKAHLIDTAGLVYADVTFQDEFLSFTNINDTLINKTIVISDQYLGKQNLTVTGIYNYGDSTSLAIETITLDVQAKELPVDLIIEPAINYGFSGERISPSYYAIFPTFVSELKSTNTDISVEIENEDVLTFNKNNNTFTGKAEGETFAIIKYFDTADTAQFIIYPSYEEEDSTDIIDSVISYETIEEKVFNVYPNPAENVLNIDYSLSETAEVEFQVVDILGRNVLKFNSDYIQSNEIKTEQISLTKVPTGIYIVYLTSNKGKISSRKIIVNK